MPANGLASVRQGSAFYINVATTAAGDAYDATGAAATLSSATTGVAGAAGAVLVRDMGKTVRIAAQGATAHVASASVALVLRKVQLVRGGPVDSNMGDANVPLSSFVGLNEGVAGEAANGFETFFIQLSPASKWARLSL